MPKRRKTRATKTSRAARARKAHPEKDPSGPKTTRPAADSRRLPEAAVRTSKKIGRKLDAQPDRIDIRDWFYQPRLTPLPDQVINSDLVPEILDQGAEGACTGFALAGVIHYLLRSRNVDRRVSPRMIYEMARRYDEWPGERYEGSSARGAMKGFVRHGVCLASSWPKEKSGPQHLTDAIAKEAQRTPGGAFYRLQHRQIRDVHAAIAEVGALYLTLMVHSGWDEPGPKTVCLDYLDRYGNARHREVPVITRKGQADDGHAVAIVGYTEEGFVIQNSWGDSWGSGGFALLPYQDYLMHATDVWAVQLGVPVEVDIWVQGDKSAERSGAQRAARSIPLSEIRPFVVDVGNNGELSDSGNYWTTDEDVRRLFEEMIPERTKAWKTKRVMLYLHGGLNDEEAVARRVVAFSNVLLDNEIYPLHIMWESGVMESLHGIIRDYFTDVDTRAGGVADWVKKLRDGLIEAKDRSFELTVAGPGGGLWKEMKENARLSSEHPDRLGGMQIILDHAGKALSGLSASDKRRWEIHVVGHSAGSIFAAHAIPLLGKLGVTFQTLQFMAPAITVDLFKSTVVGEVSKGRCPLPSLFVLSDTGERDDDVGPYGKSLLYLVSNAFEGKRDTPILGMEKFLHDVAGKPTSDPVLRPLFEKQVDGRPSLVVAGTGKDGDEKKGSLSRSDSHGGFDNDPATLNSILVRILGEPPKRAFLTTDLQY